MKPLREAEITLVIEPSFTTKFLETRNRKTISHLHFPKVYFIL